MSMTTTAAVLAGVLGLLIGSFGTVLAYRVPRGESVVSPSSHCPHCATPLKPWHNVPVVSWVALRGRCAACHAPISSRYPLIEATTGLAFAALAALVIQITQ